VSRSWIVGGALRDELLGREVTDVDVAVEDDPERAARELAKELRGPVFRLSEAFGAWRVVDNRGGRVFDFAPLQGETIEDDLRKRDFTVNALARPRDGGDLIDPLGGRADLESRTLRVIGPEAYQNDPLRPLRLARFAAELGFDPDPETERLTAAAAPRVAEASGERVFAELRRLVLAPGAVPGLALADRLGLLGAVLPELSALHDIDQSQYHHKDVYGHTLEVLERLIEVESEATGELREVLEEPLADELTRGEALRFGALLHDIGKPATHDVRADGRVTFIGHDRLGEEMVQRVCRRLRTSERLSRFLQGVTRHHLVLGFLVHERPLDRRAVYRYLKRTSPVAVEVTLLSCADRLATRGRNAERAIDAHLELARELMPAALDWRRNGPPRLPLRGDELARELGIEPGPELGRVIAELEEAAYAGEVTDRDQAVELARRLRDNALR
jgi:poly(A) polymerase